jgi:hypothetical protein
MIAWASRLDLDYDESVLQINLGCRAIYQSQRLLCESGLFIASVTPVSWYKSNMYGRWYSQ